MKVGGVSNNAPLRIQQTRRADNNGDVVKRAQEIEIVCKMLLVVFKEEQAKGG